MYEKKRVYESFSDSNFLGSLPFPIRNRWVLLIVLSPSKVKLQRSQNLEYHVLQICGFYEIGFFIIIFTTLKI